MYKYDIQDVIDKFKGEDITMLGNGPSARGFNSDECESRIWTVNNGFVIHPNTELDWRMDDITGPAVYERYNEKFPGIIGPIFNNAKQSPVPVIVPKRYPEYPAFVEFPLKRVIDDLGIEYFGETISYAVAFAIWIGVKSIQFIGTDYEGCKPSERACTEGWCFLAKSRGIKITTHPDSFFMKTDPNDGISLHIRNFYGYIPTGFPYEYKEINGGIELLKYNGGN